VASCRLTARATTVDFALGLFTLTSILTVMLIGIRQQGAVGDSHIDLPTHSIYTEWVSLWHHCAYAIV